MPIPFDFQIINGGFSYSLFQDDRFDLGLSAAAFIAPIKIRVSSSKTGAAGEESVAAPLPFVGLHF